MTFCCDVVGLMSLLLIWVPFFLLPAMGLRVAAAMRRGIHRALWLFGVNGRKVVGASAARSFQAAPSESWEG